MKIKQLDTEIKRTVSTTDFKKSKYWHNNKIIPKREKAIELLKDGEQIICDAKRTTYSIEIGIILKTVL